MFLTKNKLKKNKNVFDDDEYLHYLKFSHLDKSNNIIDDDDELIFTDDKATQFPDIRNNQTQTDKKIMVDKATAPKDELDEDEILGKYILKLTSENFRSKEPSRKDKMTQVVLEMLKETIPKTPPSSDSDSNKSTPRNLRRVVRFAEMTGSAMLTSLNLAQQVTNAVGNTLFDFFDTNTQQEEEQEDQQQIETISVQSSPPVSVHDSPPITVHSSPFPTPSSLPEPSSLPPSRMTSVGSSSKSFEGAYPKKRKK